MNKSLDKLIKKLNKVIEKEFKANPSEMGEKLLPFIQKLIEACMKKAYKQAIEDAKKCVPDEQQSICICREPECICDGFNECRRATLDNLNKL